ncbi:ABC-type dipeptide/oligopeptide/nickel transport systems, permease component [Gordonia sp. KTR9]|nr:ABC-type dipeptide/oligopeptide/nickel transport systems, permease component [Gordonia sp. KTR9]
MAGPTQVPRTRTVGRAVARRLLVSLFVLWGAITATFLVIHAGGGSPINAIIGPNQVSPEVRAQIISDYKLDDPIVVQYVNYFWRLLHGDLGQSYALRMPVSEAIAGQIWPTMQLVTVSAVLSLVVALVIGLATANRPGLIRGPVTSLEVLTVAIPTFWLGILLLTVFSFNLNWFPSVGSDGIASLVLPTIALSATPAALLSQVLRHGVEQTLHEPFVVTARSRGIGQTAVLVRHVIRHAAMPVITMWGLIVGTLISGAVVVEQVFSREGLGRLTIAAVIGKDLPLILGVVIIAATFYTIVNTLIDAAYGWLDPRLRDATSPVPSGPIDGRRADDDT